MAAAPVKVMIHADSGLLFYQKPTGETSWHNPLDEKQAPNLLDPEEREEQVRPKVVSGRAFLTRFLFIQRTINTLCGFDEAPHQLAAEAQYAAKRIGGWMDTHGVSMPRRSEVALKWPQYLNTAALLEPPVVYHVNVSTHRFLHVTKFAYEFCSV
jgi:hypothetical protein